MVTEIYKNVHIKKMYYDKYADKISEAVLKYYVFRYNQWGVYKEYNYCRIMNKTIIGNTLTDIYQSTKW